VSDEFTVPLCRLHHRALYSLPVSRRTLASFRKTAWVDRVNLFLIGAGGPCRGTRYQAPRSFGIYSPRPRLAALSDARRNYERDFIQVSD